MQWYGRATISLWLVRSQNFIRTGLLVLAWHQSKRWFPTLCYYLIGLLKLFLTKYLAPLTVVNSTFRVCGWLKSYSSVCGLPDTWRKSWVHQRDASVLLLQAGTFDSGWGAMVSGKSAAKMGHNSSIWTHTRRPIKHEKKLRCSFLCQKQKHLCVLKRN